MCVGVFIIYVHSEGCNGVGGDEREQIGVSERIIIYYAIVDGTSDLFDFFSTHTRFSFPKTRYIIPTRT